MNIHEKINSRSWYNKSSNIKGGFIRSNIRIGKVKHNPYWIELEFRKPTKKETFEAKF